jgi:hypothetical protein
MDGRPQFGEFALPLEVVRRNMPRSRLYEEHEGQYVICYEPLEEIARGRWLINVDSRVYVVDEHVLLKGMSAMKLMEG